jgi:predicted permease
MTMFQRLPFSELRFAARRLRRAPSFAATVILVLALGIGATTAMFSLVNGILLQPLPYPKPDCLVRLTHAASDAAAATVDQSDATVLLYQRQTRVFDGVAAWRFDDGDLRGSEPGQATVRARGARVTSNFFDVLGIRPALGRGFAAGEDRPGRNGVVVLSHDLWEERFHGDPSAIGRQIIVNDVPRTIVGVMPPRFAYPGTEVQLWLPLSLDPAHLHPATFNLIGIARLGPDVSAEAARADLSRALTRADASDGLPSAWQQAHLMPRVESLRDSIVGPVSHLLWLVFGSVLLVLVVACVNVAGLFLVRAERAQLELAVRGALGAGFAGLLAMTLSESFLLSVIGGGAGVLLAAATMSGSLSTGTILALPRLEDVWISAPVLLFALGVTVSCAFVVSVLPILRARRVSVAQVLRGAGMAPAAGHSSHITRDALVAAQIALALVLVASSGLMARSLFRLSQVRPGFDADHVVASSVLLPYARYGSAASRVDFYETLIGQTQAIPGARDVALTDWVPLSGDAHDVAIDVESSAPGNSAGADHPVVHVDENYFQTLHIPLLRGRVFGAQDVTRPSDEAIVSRTFAEHYWPGENALGKRVRPVGGPWFTVVGEVDDVHYDALDKSASDVVYFPIVAAGTDGGASLPGAVSVVVRTNAGDAETLSSIRRIVRGLDSAVPTYDERSLAELVRGASARVRALVVLLAIASGVTCLLGAIGLYGVMAYGVDMRRRELGIRLALGARPADVVRMVSLGGLRIAAIGIVVGIVCTLVTSRLMRGMLYDVSPTDLVTLSVTPLVLLLIALGASWIPTRRAASVDPAEVLRSQ